MTDSGGTPDRSSTTIPGGMYGNIYIPTTTVTADNVNSSHVPDQLAPHQGEAGAKTEWDVTSLDAAITWLNAHADYLKRMLHGMDSIKTLMDGPKYGDHVMQNSGMGGQQMSPLGGFPWAGKLTERHSQLYQSYQTGLKTVIANLYDAADALTKVKEKYGDVEHANAMSAQDMETDFNDARSVPHNI